MDKIVIVVEKGMVQSALTHTELTLRYLISTVRILNLSIFYGIVCRKWSRYSAKFIERSLRYECE